MSAQMRQRLLRWLWYCALYVLVVYVALLLSHYFAAPLPHPSDVGWSE
jgi:hypothetical protein